MNRFPRRLHKTAGVAAMATVLLVPASASASQGYVVTLAPAANSTCEATIQAVTAAYSIAPKHVYTSALCGFSASISKRTVEQLRLDSRVKSVDPDGTTSSF